MPAPLGAPGDDVVCGWVPHHVIPAHKACLSRRCSGEACGQRAKARRSRLCQERRRLVLLRLVPGVLIAAHWPLRTGAAAGGARGRHCLRASLQLPGLAPQAICARLTTETARFSVARRSSACRVGLYPGTARVCPRLVVVGRQGLPDLQAQFRASSACQALQLQCNRNTGVRPLCAGAGGDTGAAATRGRRYGLQVRPARCAGGCAALQAPPSPATPVHQLRPARSEALNYSGPLPSVSPDGQYVAAAEGDRVVVRAVGSKCQTSR